MEYIKSKSSIKLSTLLLSVYIFLSPLDMVLNFSGSGTILKYIGMIMVPIIILELMIYRERLQIGSYLIFILLYGFYFMFGYLYSFNPSKTYVGVTSLINLIALLIILSVRKYNSTEYELIKYSSIISIVVLSYRMIMDSANVYFGRGSFEINGVYVDPNDVSAAFIIPIIFCIDKLKNGKLSNKILWLMHLLILSFMGYALLITGSRGGLLAVFVAIVVYFLANSEVRFSKKIFSIALSLLLAGLLFYLVFDFLPRDVQERMSLDSVEETGGSGRMYTWTNAWNLFLQSDFYREIFGYGLATFTTINQVFFGGVGGPHNIYLQTLLEGGVLGIVILFAMIIVLIKTAIKNRNWIGMSILVGTLIMSVSLETWNKKFFWNAIFLAVITLISNVNDKSKNKGV